ncbi:MAG TPA: GNAT family N-acetyltransferase [Kofleriaceae bacterium]|nr:GNAT family N-acetyltransferase [Kofleriaceae bacterium]
MTVEVQVLRDLSALRAIEPEWRALAATGGSGALFRGPDWLIPWWHAYHQVLGAELHILAGRENGELVALAPLYTRTAKLAMLDVREVRMLGDAGPRPPALDILCKPGVEERAAAALAKAIVEEGERWDVVELTPLADPSRVRGHLVSRLGAAGMQVESTPAAGGARRVALQIGHTGDTTPPPMTDGMVSAYVTDPAALRKGLSALRRLSRLEWAEREETSPLADAEATALLEEVAIALAPSGRSRLARLDDGTGEAMAAALIVDDGDRAVVLAIAVDPRGVARGAAQRLITAEAVAAAMRGRIALDVVTGATEYALPPMPVSKQGALAVRVWAPTKTASVTRTARSVARGAKAAVEAPAAAAAQARAAWAKIRGAASNVAHYHRMHLYRGQLWTRGIEAPPGLELALYGEADFDRESDAGRADLLEQLELTEELARRAWQRGDLALLARLNGRPAGITWAARGPVEVPELGRTLRMTKYEAYIHDVFVAPAARGRNVAPVMLEHLARELRERDVFRAWALIGSDNGASVRSFVKAGYTPVSDVIRAHVANLDRLIVRPPDPEARELLGV